MTALEEATSGDVELGARVDQGGVGVVVVFPTSFFFPLPNSVVSVDAKVC